MSRGKALVIDDEKNIRLTLSKCLSYVDMEVDEAINGEEGLQKIIDNKDDLVFLDLKMQGMDGLEVLKRVREKEINVSVVIVTAHGTVDVAVEAMKLGAADFMQKPFTPREIQDIVNKILSRKRLAENEEDDYGAYIELAKDQITRKKYEAAREYLKKAIGKDPVKAEPHNILGAIMEINAEYEEAKKHYKAALALEPGYSQAQRNLARVVKKIKENKES
ncbi:MAG: response regulator [Vulcanimicrobiota bacterium]